MEIDTQETRTIEGLKIKKNLFINGQNYAEAQRLKDRIEDIERDLKLNLEEQVRKTEIIINACDKYIKMMLKDDTFPGIVGMVELNKALKEKISNL